LRGCRLGVGDSWRIGKLHAEVWGHTVSLLLAQLPPEVAVPGAPTDLYTLDEADNAIAIAGEVIEFCKGLLAGQGRA